MDSYEKRSAWILGRGLGVWDVYASCEREGSLDTAIRHPQVNDFADLQRRCPALQVIAHNGRDDLPPRTSHGRTVPAGLPLALHQSGQRQLEL